MAAGLPVVTTRIGGIPETVDDGQTGMIVEPGDIAGLAQAIFQLVQDKALREGMGEMGKIKAETYFDAKVVAQQFLDIAVEHS